MSVCPRKAQAPRGLGFAGPGNRPAVGYNPPVPTPAPTLPTPPLADPVRRHVRTDHARLPADATVAAALDGLRKHPPGGRIVYFYAVDAAGKLVGVVPTRRLLTAPLDAAVRDVANDRVVAVPADATVAEACEFFVLHRLLGFPVVEPDRTLLGVVDVSLYTDEVTDLDRREAEDDLFQLVGVHLDDARRGTPAGAFRTRFPWLLANVAGGLAAAGITGLFGAELRAAVSLAAFVPVVLALAESVAIQSVGLALQAPAGRPAAALLRGEAAAGGLLGLACAAAVGLVALAWLGAGPVVGAVCGGIAGGVTAAALLGAAVPLLLRRLHREPQVAAGPVALALTDVATLLAYFGLARVLL